MVTEQDILSAVMTLRAGGLVAFPTETVYGLGADALNATAVSKVFEAKQRPRFDPVIVHLADSSDAEKYVTNFDQRAQLLADAFWPGPLTLVLPCKEIVPDIVTAGLPTVAVRVPSHPIALALLRKFGSAIAAPSANRFGSISPTTAEHVRHSFGNQFPILDSGATTVGIESTILELCGVKPILLRPGAITQEQIEQLIGKIEVHRPKTHQITAPGQMPRHYAPMLPMVLLGYGSTPEPIPGRRCACLLPTFRNTSGFHSVEVLSTNEDLKEMAVNLFSALRRLEQLPVDCIVAVEVKPEGLGIAINDRLRRASAPKEKTHEPPNPSGS